MYKWQGENHTQKEFDEEKALGNVLSTIRRQIQKTWTGDCYTESGVNYYPVFNLIGIDECKIVGFIAK